MSKYIRTEDGIYVFEDFTKTRGERCLNHYGYQDKDGVCILGTLQDWKCYKKANTVEELCDEFVRVSKSVHDFLVSNDIPTKKFDDTEIYGAIWTDKGLIYVAKMNESGVLELL